MANHSQPHETERGLWVISIGFYIKDGKRTQKKHWLGRDKVIAQKKARALHIAWENETNVNSEGRKVWDPATIEAALSFAEPTRTPAPTPTVQTAPEVRTVFAPETYTPPTHPTAYTFELSLDEFAIYTKGRTDIGEDHREGITDALECIKARLDEITMTVRGQTISLRTLPVMSIDSEWLDAIRNYVTGRPPRKLDNKPISINTVSHWLMHLSTAFDWFGRTKRIGWQAPADWRDYFSLTDKHKWSMMTDPERSAFGKPLPCFTVEELVKIHKCGTPLERMYLLMGLLLGWSQEGIKSFLKEQFVKRGDDYYIEKPRSKNSGACTWWVAPELAAILEKAIEHTAPNKHGYAFTNDDGDNINARTDTIRLTWDRALSHAPMTVRNLPFGRVKKRGAQLVQDISGSPQLARLFLAHSSTTVAEKHYASSDTVTDDCSVDLGKSQFQRLHDTQREIWKRLKPLFFPAKVVKQPQREEVAA